MEYHCGTKTGKNTSIVDSLLVICVVSPFKKFSLSISKLLSKTYRGSHFDLDTSTFMFPHQLKQSNCKGLVIDQEA